MAAHCREKARAAGLEARMKRDGRDPKAGGRQNSIGRDMGRAAEPTGHEEREYGPHRPDRDPDAERIVAARTLRLSSPDRTADPTEQMRAQQIPADTPDHDAHGNRTEDSELHEELQ